MLWLTANGPPCETSQDMFENTDWIDIEGPDVRVTLLYAFIVLRQNGITFLIVDM